AIADATSGTAAKVNGFGQLVTAVSGTVNAVGAAPSSAFVEDVVSSTLDTACAAGPRACASIANSSGMNMVVTSVTIDNDGTSPQRWELMVCPSNIYQAGACMTYYTPTTTVLDVNFPDEEAHSVEFPTGVVVPNTSALVIVDETISGSPHAFLGAAGY